MHGSVIKMRDDCAKVVEFLLKVILCEVDIVAETSEGRTQLSDNEPQQHRHHKRMSHPTVWCISTVRQVYDNEPHLVEYVGIVLILHRAIATCAIFRHMLRLADAAWRVMLIGCSDDLCLQWATTFPAKIGPSTGDRDLSNTVILGLTRVNTPNDISIGWFKAVFAGLTNATNSRLTTLLWV